MDKETRSILNIIKSSITEENIEISDELSLKKLIELTNRHNIFILVYYGLINCNVSIDEKLNTQLTNAAISGVYINEQQLYYIKEISSQFDKNNIDYMFLKGSVLKHYYPKPEIRRMGDIDVLIKEEQYNKISSILKKIGFSFRNESNHEIIWTKNNIVIELHKILMPSYNKDLHEYFGNGWDKAVKTGKNSYAFSDDDMLIYLFSHFTKHYREAGIGITHMCDLYVFLMEKHINENYVKSELTSLKLYDFYCNIKETLAVWFENEKSSEMTDYITAVIFNSGVYGLRENVLISSALREKNQINNIALGRLHRIWQKIFPSYRGMKTRYQILKKYPFLLPLFWIYRLIDIIFFRRKDISKNLNDICVINEQEIQTYETALNYVGLDYDF